MRLFVVDMTGAQENPPVTNPTTTTGQPRPVSFGTARFQFNEAQTALSFTATITNINFHTRQFPGGEIRGNFPAATASRDSLVPA